MEHGKHVFRIVILVAVILVVVMLGRGLLIPKTYGLYGRYRAANVAEQMNARPVLHGGAAACARVPLRPGRQADRRRAPERELRGLPRPARLPTSWPTARWSSRRSTAPSPCVRAATARWPPAPPSSRRSTWTSTSTGRSRARSASSATTRTRRSREGGHHERLSRRVQREPPRVPLRHAEAGRRRGGDRDRRLGAGLLLVHAPPARRPRAAASTTGTSTSGPT